MFTLPISLKQVSGGTGMDMLNSFKPQVEIDNDK